MSVLIKGVDTPLTCWGCPCFDDEITHYCCVLDRYCDDYKNNRLNDCPLVEIPTPHGRLIDADRAAVAILMMNNHPCGHSIENISDVVDWLKIKDNNIAFPTIIEAEVSE